MYKEIRQIIHENRFEKSESYSEEEAIEFLKKHIEKELQYLIGQGISEEEVKKSFRQAFKTGLTVLGLIHGAHYMGMPDSDQKAPQAQTRSPALVPASDEGASSQRIPNSYKDKMVNNFVRAIHMGEGRKDISQDELDAHRDKAYKLHETYAGDENRMAYHWGQGEDFKPEHFEDPTHQDYKESPFVEQYFQNRKTIEKSPANPLPIKSR